jgi:hypothetical protein
LINSPEGKAGNYLIPTTVKFIGDSAFLMCINLTSIIIPEGTNSIGEGAFKYCVNLTSVSIPTNVNSIGSDAFGVCVKLDSVYVYSSTPVDLSLSSSVFESISSTCKLFVPAGSKEAYQNAYQWKDFKQIIDMTTGLQSIGKSNIKIETNNGKLIINNAESGNVVQLYSASGFKIKEQRVENSQTSFSLPSGIYMIRIGNYSGKVVVK